MHRCKQWFTTVSYLLLLASIAVSLMILNLNTITVSAQEETADEAEVTPPDPTSDDIVERGRYLVRVEANCVSCHGAEGYELDPLGISLSGGRGFSELYFTVHAPNLTILDDWTDEELEIAIRYGQHPAGIILMPPMPYTLYAGMADADMEAIIAYLRILEPVESEIPEIEFVRDFAREEMRTVPDFDLDMEIPYPEDMDEDLLVRGQYMASHTARCLSCHGSVLQLEDDEGLARLPDPHGPAAGRVISEYPSLLQDDLAEWGDDDLRAIFKNLDLFAMPTYSFQYLVERDVEALVTWLRSQPSSEELDR